MVYDDCAYHRKLFFYAFITMMPLITICNLIMYGNPLLDSVVYARQLCWLTDQGEVVTGSGSEEDQNGGDDGEND